MDAEAEQQAKDRGDKRSKGKGRANKTLGVSPAGPTTRGEERTVGQGLFFFFYFIHTACKPKAYGVK